MEYTRLRWLKGHLKTAHPQCTSNGEEQSLTVERKSRERKSPDEKELEVTAEEEIQPANDPSLFQCPKCPRTYKVLKSLHNHCCKKHAWSSSRQMPVRGRETVTDCSLVIKILPPEIAPNRESSLPSANSLRVCRLNT